MVFARARSLLAAGATVFALAALAAPAICQDRQAAASSGIKIMAQAERPLPVRIDAAGRYLIVAPGTISHAPDPSEAQRIHDALERAGFRIAHERNATPLTMANSIKRLIENGVQPANIAVLGMGEDVKFVIDVAQAVYHPMVNYVIIAGCEKMPSFASRVPLKARILSLQIQKDGATPSCRGVFAGRGAATGFEFEEYVIKRDANPAMMELVLTEAISAWTRAGYDDDGVR
ncbi:MAG: hypothetical protein K0S54_1351 [Alphaproteobacteria bacterium]|jgi:hypothetical protein|nr:hypothetical protein [Alphaproteobacteria bacterium]